MTVARLAHFNSLRPRPSNRPPRLLRLAWCLGAAAALLSLSSPSHAGPDDKGEPAAEGSKAKAAIPRVPLGFSNLLFRIEGKDEIGIGNQDIRVRMLERLRERGFEAVGAENLVFGKDESYRAAFRLGGTVREVKCIERGRYLRCKVGIDWELLDVARDAVVYTVRTWGLVLDGEEDEKAKLGAKLLLDALDSLTEHEGFRKALSSGGRAAAAGPSFPRATFARCAGAGKKMPAGAEEALAATVLVRTERGHGSGFFLTADGLVLTAAHVLDGPTATLRLRDGTELDAVAVRVSPRADVALLRTSKPVSGQRCLAPAASPPAVGAEVYAAGAPADAKLAFSLTRGIVSGTREIDGRKQLQTDAAVSGGNSGGPLLDGSGAAAAVVVSKLVGKTVEGVAFGVPIRDALSAVGLNPGSTTDPALVRASAASVEKAGVARVDEEPDPSPMLDPEQERRERARAKAEQQRSFAEMMRDEARREDQEATNKAREQKTPAVVKTLFWVGGGLAVTGAVVAFQAHNAVKDAESRHDTGSSASTYRSFGLLAMISGLGMVGAAAVVQSSISSSPSPKSTVTLGPGGVRWEGTF